MRGVERQAHGAVEEHQALYAAGIWSAVDSEAGEGGKPSLGTDGCSAKESEF